MTTAAVASRGIILGVNVGRTGTFNLSGTGTLTMPSGSYLEIGRYDSTVVTGTTGIFNQTGAASIATVGTLGMGGGIASNSGTTAQLNLSAGVFSAASFVALSVGDTSNSTINISGTADVTLPALPTARGSGSTATINFDGGTLKPLATSADFLGAGATPATPVTSAFIKNGGAKFDTTNANITIAQALNTHGVSTGGGLTKAGTNTLTLSGVNTYTGDTYVVADTLAFASGGSSNSSAIRIGDFTGSAAATLVITDAAGGNAVNSTLVVRTGSSGVKTIKATNTSGTSTYGGSVYLDELVTISADTLGGTLAFTGTEFDLKAQQLTATGGGNTTISNILKNSTGAGKIVKQGTGTLILTGANTYSGNTEIDIGAIRVDATPGNASSAYYVGNGTTTATAGSLLLGGAGGTGGGVTLSNLIAINPGSGNNRTLGGTNSTGTTNTFAGTTYSNGGSLTVTSTNAGATLAFTNTQAIDLKSATALFNGAGNSTVSGALYNSTGSGSVTKDGTGTLTLTGLNTYTGNTTVNAGTLALADNAQLKFVLGATSGSNNSITGTGTVTLDGDFVIDTSAADSLTSGTWTMENVTSLSGAYGSTFTVVGFVDAGGDKWTKTLGSKKYTFDETTGVLTLATIGGYTSWAAINAPGSAPGLDYDGDGVSNAVEYILGSSKDTNDLSKLPTVDASGSNLVFSFQRAQSSIDGTTTVAIQVGTTLTAWPDSYSVPETALANNPGVTVQKDTPAVGTDTVTLRVVKAPDATKFARLVVTPAP